MKPFDLEKAKAGNPVVTRDGDAITDMMFDKKLSNGNTICGFKYYGDETCAFFSWNDDGSFRADKSISDFDLFMKSVKHEAWINIYKDKTCCVRWDTKEEALKGHTCHNGVDNPYYITTIKIEWEE